MLFTPFYFAPCSLVGFVRCTGGHPLKALYVILRPKPAANLPEDLLAERDTPFSLVWTGPEGHTLLVTEDDGPEIHEGFFDPAKLTPHGFKLMSDRTYECYFLRHPDLNWVRQALSELNGFAAPSLTRDWKPTDVKPSMETITPPKPDKDTPAPDPYTVLTLTIGEMPEQYYPRGPERYGKWMLYKDMPNADCPLVRKAVTELQEELGSLRYMVGSEHPYMPERLVKGNADTANEGIFDGRTVNAVYLFQKNALEGRGWQVDDWDATIAKSGRDENEQISLAYLKGKPSTARESGLVADGVVDTRTADAIRRWHALGICNPDKIMVCLPAREGKLNWFVWMRPEAAEALYCWRELVRALGFPETIAANHTFRSAAVNVGSAGFGRSWKSIHKVGLAIDVGLDKNYYEPAVDWPVFYERDVVTVKKTKKGELGSFRIYWRVFAVSNLAIPNPAAIEDCKKNLQTVQQNTHPLGALARKAAGKLLKEIEAGTFAAKYFRRSVKQWQYDAWDPDGGKEGPSVDASAARAAQFNGTAALLNANAAKRTTLQADLDALNAIPAAQRTKDWKGARANRQSEIAALDRQSGIKRDIRSRWSPEATRFVDLTALAEEAGLERIGSFSNHENPKNTSEWGQGLLTISIAKLNTLAKSLSDLKATNPNFEVEIGGESVPLIGVDTDFITEWANSRKDFKLCPDVAPAIACAISQDKKGEARMKQFCEGLRKFGTRKFVRIPDGTVQTGEAWAAAVEAKLAEIKAAAPVEKKDSSKKSTKKKDPADWTFRLNPVVSPPEKTQLVLPLKSTVQLPSPGAPIGLEWWHFQVSALIDHQPFGPLICEMGWTKETLLDDPLPQFYHRFGMGYPQNAWTVTAG